MRSPISVGRRSFSLKASHHRVSLRISHRSESTAPSVKPEPERERYIAPPKRKR